MTYKEQQYYEEWVDDPTPENLQKILDEVDPIINKAVQKWSGGLAPSGSLKIKAKNLAVKAIKTYSPESSTRLSTWVYTYLQKLSRFTNKYSILHVSEGMKEEYNRYLREKQAFMNEHDGDRPAVSEMADRLMIPESKIIKLEKNFSPQYHDSTIETSKFLHASHLDTDDLIYAYRNLSPEEQKLVSLKTGWPDDKPLTLSEIAKKREVSATYMSKRYAEIADKLKKILRRKS